MPDLTPTPARDPQVRSVLDVTLDAALAVLEGVRTTAMAHGRALAATVVDTGGNAVATIRMDGAQLVAAPLAAGKAWTAVACNAPTESWAECSLPGASDWGLAGCADGRFTVIAGGLPLRVDGRCTGGVGVSGGPAAIDRMCAQAGLLAAGFDPL